jgi:hypothetical protein
MNKARIIGGILIIIGIILVFLIDYDVIGFLGGATLGIGIGFVLTGRFSYKTKTD